MPDVRTHTPRGELTRVGARTSTADLRVEDWFLPSFQAAWWNETRSIRNPLAHIGRGGVMATLVTDTASDFVRCAEPKHLTHYPDGGAVPC